MAQSYLMTVDQFEQQKNMKAGAYTAAILVALAIFLFLVSWQLPQIAHPDPPLELQGIEVNLGTDETGFGTDQPLLPGDPAPEANTAPPHTAMNNAGDDADSDVPVVKNEVKNVNTKPTEATKVTASITKPVTNPTPAPPKPKAVYSGGSSTGTGGNNADTYNGVRNQGIAGGNGDQGQPNGNPNSDSYKGNGGSGKSGVQIRSGLNGRRFTSLPSFTDDFNENASVAVDIKVNADGRVLSAVVNPRGTTTTNANIRSIASRKAMQLKLNASGDEEQTGTILFSFKLRG